MKRRGMSHVEMILAFVLFILALVIALSYAEIDENPSLLEATHASVLKSLEENTSVSVETYSVIMLPVAQRNKTTTVILNGTSGKESRVVNYTGSILSNITKIGDLVYVDWNEDYGRVIKIQVSDDFNASEGNATDKPAHNETYYLFSSVYGERVISEKKFAYLVQAYQNNISMLKLEWHIPDNRDFSFALKFSSTEVIAPAVEIPEGVDVISTLLRREVARQNGTREFAGLEVKTW